VSTFGHPDDRWEHVEILPGEPGGAGESKATPSTRSATIVNSDCANSGCTDQVPLNSFVTTRASDVHGCKATREADVHCENVWVGDADRSDGDSRVTVSEAAEYAWCEKSPAHSILRQQVSPRPDSQESKSNPLGKGLNHDLTAHYNLQSDKVSFLSLGVKRASGRTRLKPSHLCNAAASRGPLLRSPTWHRSAPDYPVEGNGQQ
jgi:hypothetical protein